MGETNTYALVGVVLSQGCRGARFLQRNRYGFDSHLVASFLRMILIRNLKLNIVEKARVFATAAHNAIGQVRKYSGEPYINHPKRVVSIVNTVTIDPTTLAVAWLHDVVEDTDVTLKTIEEEFGHDIAMLVENLTDVSKKSDGNRATRKAIDREHTANADRRAKTVKLADLIDNTRDILDNDESFAKVYIKEKEQLLPVLREGDSSLFVVANMQLLEAKKKLEG